MKNKFNIIIRAILCAVGGVVFVVYALPLFGGILNVGNAVGMAVGASLVAVGVFFARFVALCKRLWQYRVARVVLPTCAVVIVAFTALFGFTYKSVYDHAMYTATDQKTVIVLGCKVNGDKPSMMLKWRSVAAAEYMLDHPDAVAILSGGQGSNEGISEAQCIYNVMTEYGISPDRLYLEDKSTSTDENIAFSKRIIEENGLSHDVAIATSDYHERRAAIIAAKNGLTSASIPAYGDKYSRVTFYTREVFGVWLQYLQLCIIML